MELAHTELEARMIGECLKAVGPGIIEWSKAALIGSASIIGPERAEDWDVLFLVGDAHNTALIMATKGWSQDGSNAPGPEDGDDWRSLKKDKWNVIVCEDEDFYKQWVQANEVCKYLRLEKKEDRIAVHCIVMDGYTAQQFKREEVLA